MGLFQKVEGTPINQSNGYRYKPLDFKPVEDGYAYVAETFWGSVVLIRISTDDDFIWLRFHYENEENVGDMGGFYNRPLLVEDIKTAIEKANTIYEHCLFQQFEIISRAEENT